jgi:hypothetical protein
MKNILNKKILGCVYFLNKGERIGQFLVFVKYNKEKSLYSVLTLPDCEPIFISESEMNSYIEENTLEFVEKLPKKIRTETNLEFEHRISSIN